MGMAIVRLRGPLQQRAGAAEHAVAGATVAGALQALEDGRPALAGWILDERGAVRRHITVFVNGDQSRPDAAVGEHDRIDVVPAISGG